MSTSQSQQRPRLVHVKIAPRADPDPAGFDPAGVPFIPWARFRTELLPGFKQGEHISLISLTGGGKTTLLAHPGGILSTRDRMVVLATKTKDTKLYAPLLAQGYVMTEDPVLNHEKHPRVIFRPKLQGIEDADLDYQREKFRLLLRVLHLQGGWGVCLEELPYLATELKLRTQISTFAKHARSSGNTLIMGMQSPVEIPRAAVDQVGHIFALQIKDLDRIKRVAEIMAPYGEEVKRILPRLPRYNALYFRSHDQLLVRTKYQQI
jgi:energy-coupling factor transporter ATP-binding protein EcfA2